MTEATQACDATEKPAIGLALLAVLVASIAGALAIVVRDDASRAYFLSGFLLLLAGSEGFFGASALLWPRRSDTGSYAIYVRQHVGIYNLFAVLIYVLAALDPVGNIGMVQAAIALYVVHAGYELCCYLGLAPAAERSFKPRKAYLIDAVTLLTVIIPVAIFYPI